jgi:methionyl-tRNA synthetase
MEGIVKFSEWQKLDLRVAKILEVENVEGADRLYKLTIDLGNRKRTLVAGLKEHYTQEELRNKKVIVFTNLEPRKIKGIESQGMILAAVDEENSQVQLLQSDKDIKIGSKVC